MNDMTHSQYSSLSRSATLAVLSVAVLAACGGGTSGSDTISDGLSASDTSSGVTASDTLSSIERYRRNTTTTTTTAATTTTPAAPASTTSTASVAWTECAEENGTCSFSGTHSVKYGVTSAYVIRAFTNTAACNNATFGDPAVHQWKKCWIDSSSAAVTPAPTTATAPVIVATAPVVVTPAPAPAPAPAPPPPPAGAGTSVTPAIEYLGRFDFSDPAGARFSWSDTTIKARFNGTSARVRLYNVYDNNYTAVVDGGSPTLFTLSAGTTTWVQLASGLSPGLHTVQITRNNSTFNGITQFLGFDFGTGTLAAPAAYASPLRLEVYGDSISAAGGIAGANCSDPINAENEYLGYAPKATRILGARAPTMIVYSGHGIYHGYNDSAGVRTIPGIYDQDGVSGKWNFPADSAPNVVLIALGTNDISTVPSTGQDPSDATLTAAYVSFAHTLRSRYPSAAIVLTVGPMTFGYQTASVAAVSQLNAAGDSKVYSLIHSSQTLTGCAGHPGEAQNTTMANELVALLKNLGY